jgi:hypothetical protein
VGPFCLGNGTFDGDMVDLAIIVLALSLGFKVGIRASGDCEDHTMSREGCWCRWW